jgi:hypothetical protein
MDMQAAPPTYAEMNTGRPPVGNPPVLGQQIPGMSGGLPAQGGLSVLANPMAEQLQSFGRGDDSMLVHMTPGEVNSLQGLAMATGGSLTINPHTGLPEAGWLGKLLPTILGAIATPLTGGLINPLTASALIGAGTGIATGNLKKGLMAGLQAYGGAALGSAAGLNAGSFGIGQAANVAKNVVPGAVSNLSSSLTPAASASLTTGATQAIPTVVNPLASSAIEGAVNVTGNLAGATAGRAASAPGFFGRFAQAAKAGLPAGTPGIIAKNAPMIAGLGVLSGVSGAMTPSGYAGPTGMVDNSYAGPYTAQKRTPSFAKDTGEILGSSKERRYFDVDMPEVYNVQGQVVQPGSSTARGTPIMQNYLLPTNKKTPKGSPMYGQRLVPYMMADEDMGYADGGEIELADGAFVLDARTVSEMGNGSSNAGMEALRRIGGRPIKGPGDGVSDSIPARIGRDQPARVARDEVVVPAEAVRRIGKGNQKRGADKLYALMDKAHKARKKAKRGQDTKLRRGLV